MNKAVIEQHLIPKRKQYPTFIAPWAAPEKAITTWERHPISQQHREGWQYAPPPRVQQEKMHEKNMRPNPREYPLETLISKENVPAPPRLQTNIDKSFADIDEE